jgi:hypothetical protein
MNEYTNKRIQKEGEAERLAYFLDEYLNITGERIEIIEIAERPDFICSKENGCKIGIELTMITRGDPQIIQYDRIIDKKDFMSPEQAIDMIQQSAILKENKRSKGDWKLPDSNILLIELTDIPLNWIQALISPKFCPDLYSTGFMEVWIADFTGIEAYDNLETYCVQSKEWAGYYPRQMQKPYG